MVVLSCLRENNEHLDATARFLSIGRDKVKSCIA
jgi:hypothetical protein